MTSKLAGLLNKRTALKKELRVAKAKGLSWDGIAYALGEVEHRILKLEN